MANQSLGRILITGGAGFVGSNLVRRLRELDCAAHIRVIDNESVGNRKVLEGFDVEFVKADIRDTQQLRTALNQIDLVVHLAADTRVMDSIADPTFNFENNVQATFNLLVAMRAAGVEKIANASTGGAILGDVKPPVHEEMAPKPTSPYGAAKLAVEGYCSAFSESFGLQAISLRFSNVYGPLSYHKGSVVAAFLRNVKSSKPLTVYGDGSQIRDYVFAADLCDGIIAALSSGQTGVYQLGTGIPTTLNQLISAIRETVGSNNPVEVNYEDFRSGEIRDTYCDISNASQAFGYCPVTDLRDGLRQTWDWFNTAD